MLCVILYASPADEAHVKKITEKLDELGVAHAEHRGSAHKEPLQVLEFVKKYEGQKVVFVTIAGRSNALSGFVAGNTASPVIACPPFSDKMDFMVNINSTLQMPSNVPAMTILDPGNCALAVKRIFDLHS